MDEKIVIALIGLASAVIGGLIASWANWGVEKRRQKLMYRRELIKSWRDMVSEVLTKAGQDPDQFNALILNHKDHLSLMPHLKHGESPRELGRIHAELAAQLSWNPYAILYASEIARIEREWDLV